MVRMVGSVCQKCGEAYGGPFVKPIRPAAEVRYMTEHYVHGVLHAKFKTISYAGRPDGTCFGDPLAHLESVHCGGHPLYATEPVR